MYKRQGRGPANEQEERATAKSEKEQLQAKLASLLNTSDAADDLLCVDLGGRRIIKKKNIKNKHLPVHINTQQITVTTSVL